MTTRAEDWRSLATGVWLVLIAPAILIGMVLILPPAAGVDLEPVAGGLTQPVDIVFSADGAELYVAEQVGTVRRISAGVPLSPPFLDLTDDLSNGFEQGLLGMALHPGYAANRRFFVYYTDRDGAVVVSEYRADAAGERAEPGSDRILLRIEEPHEFHNGGGLRFGPEGYLYVGVGDGGGDGDPWHNGQDPHTLLGTILRLDVDGPPPYRIPPDNPFATGQGGAPEVFAYGLRNPWRFSFDVASGELWIADVGQAHAEEIDRVARDVAPGTNFGWSVVEGEDCFRSETCDRAGLTPPLVEYDHASGDCAVIGGFVYRGASLPELTGLYVYGDYCSGRIRAFDASHPASVPRVVLQATLNMTAFGADPRGELYVADRAGSVYELVRHRR